MLQWTVDKFGQKLLYIKLAKALYGMMKSALLLYRKLITELREKGFELNPYDPCVANAIVNGKQITVTWHVDNLKISHVDPRVVTALLKYLSIYMES